MGGYQDVVVDDSWFSISTAEYVVLGIGGFVHFINVLVCFFLVYHRNYAPLKVRQVPLVIMALFGKLFFLFENNILLFFYFILFDNKLFQKKKNELAAIVWWIGAVVLFCLF